MSGSRVPKYIQDLSDILAGLPGVGPKMANRLSIFLATKGMALSTDLERALGELREQVKICENCNNLTQESICQICQDETRGDNNILVVETALDLIQIESTGIFQGKYLVLGGLISPLNGIGPEQIGISLLLKRLDSLSDPTNPPEVILALSTTLEGDATSMYITEEVKRLFPGVKVSRLGTGMPTGAEIEFLDSGTIKGAIMNRGAVSN